ncbi:MAG: hypothetical protein IJ679_09145 [Lachnospiraceae bacterium]|nr:hypothetical protein [Lachnospiraceae bacterium]
MMYPFMTLDDETEIVHSDADDTGRVEVYIEKPDESDGFHHMKMILPDGKVEDIYGFAPSDVKKYKEIVDNSPLNRSTMQ